jgi:hypothetical protein
MWNININYSFHFFTDVKEMKKQNYSNFLSESATSEFNAGCA